MLDAAFPCEESRGAEKRLADEPVDRPVDDQGEQRIAIAIEHARDDFREIFGDGVAEHVVDLIEGPAQQAQKRLIGLLVAGSAQNVKPAKRQQAFVIGQFPAFRGTRQNRAQFRRGLLDSQRAHSDGEARQLRSVATA